VYLTDMTREAADTMGITLEQHGQLVNPFLEQGNPADIGHFSVAAAIHETYGFESGASYCIFPIPPTYRDDKDPERTGSVLYNATAHSAEMDGLNVDDLRVAVTKITQAYYSNGKKVPEQKLQEIVAGIEEARRSTLQASSSQ
jgi:hypothetical protein